MTQRILLVADAPPFVSIAADASNTCGLTAACEAWCWGQDVSGQLGRPGAESCTLHGFNAKCAKSPQLVSDRSFTRISVGSRHTCADA